MDYTIVVLERIREARRAGLAPREAAAEGVGRDRRTVTSAALVMVAVFAVFATLRMVENKQLGVGLATAVLLDATIVRGVALPAVVTLLGDRGWRVRRRPPRLGSSDAMSMRRAAAMPLSTRRQSRPTGAADRRPAWRRPPSALVGRIRLRPVWLLMGAGTSGRCGSGSRCAGRSRVQVGPPTAVDRPTAGAAASRSTARSRVDPRRSSTVWSGCSGLRVLAGLPPRACSLVVLA